MLGSWLVPVDGAAPRSWALVRLHRTSPQLRCTRYRPPPHGGVSGGWAKPGRPSSVCWPT